MLNVFLLADFNIVLRDKKVTAGHVESLLRIKYGIKAVYFTHVMQIASADQLLQTPTLRANRRKVWADGHIAERADAHGHQIIYSLSTTM